MPKVPSLPHRPRQSIDSQAVDMWTTLKKRSPHAHSHNKCKCQAPSDIDQEAVLPYFNTSHHSHPPSTTHRFPRGGSFFCSCCFCPYLESSAGCRADASLGC